MNNFINNYDRDSLRWVSFLLKLQNCNFSFNIIVIFLSLIHILKDKYILTSFGTIKIKDLFVSKLSVGKNDEDVAVTIIKKKIKNMIDKENKKKPLSDQVICDNLNSEKINISRRTVAKYREELGIQSSSKRKRI